MMVVMRRERNPCFKQIRMTVSNSVLGCRGEYNRSGRDCGVGSDEYRILSAGSISK